MRAVQWEGAPADDDFLRFVETCVQCRGCEPACPSGVQFGRLMEGTRAALATDHRITPRWQRLGLRLLGRHRLLLAGSSVLAAAQRARLVPGRLGLAGLRVRRPPALTPTGGDVWLFTGCVMDAWMRDVHHATAAIVTAAGVTYALPGPGGACCGALHVHAGLEREARRLARRVIDSMPGSAPIVVNSAGCGAMLKDYDHLLGSPEAAAFSKRVVDVHEWLVPHLDELPPAKVHLGPVVVQDPCHLRHVQKAHLAVRSVLTRVADVVELDDDGLCCGAGGAYSVLQPELAGEIRQRKLASIARAAAFAGSGDEALVVASANPGCAMHLAAAGVTVVHPIELLAAGVLAGHTVEARRSP